MALIEGSNGIEKRELISVYVLQLVNRKYYTGMTNDMARRLGEHDRGESRSTKLFLPVELIFVIHIEGRQLARKLEVKIKRRGARKYLNWLKFSPDKYSMNIEKDLEQYKGDKKERVINEKK